MQLRRPLAGTSFLNPMSLARAYRKSGAEGQSPISKHFRDKLLDLNMIETVQPSGRARLAQTGGPEVARPLSRSRGELAPEAMDGRVRDWLRREHAGRVAALRPLPASPLLREGDYRDLNAWQLAAIAALEAGPAARAEARRAFPAAGVEVVVFEVR
jgi:hypothetical protein